MPPGEHPLLARLPAPGSSASNDEILLAFLGHVEAQGLSLYDTQEEAILELLEEKNLILNTPTGSGKSLVATALHFQSLSKGRRSVYTCPIKALVNEKFLALCRDFGPERVGMATGDATVNRDAPILCCTAEILSNIALRHGGESGIDDVIMDEFHYYSDKERGMAWQVPLLTMSKTRFLLMSATLGDTKFFESAMTQVNGRPTVAVKAVKRPVPLEYSYVETPLEQTVQELIDEGKAPVYVVHFTQLECAQNAQSFLSLNFCSREEKERIAEELEPVSFNSPYGPELKKFLRHGVGVHHAGLLPRYRILVERLAQKGLLKLICGTDTLGVGVNVPIRTALLTRLSKYDGEKTGLLTSRDFHQITGRAGRKGFDDIGYVVCMAPEHVIENAKMERKAGGDPQKLKKVVKKRAPEGFVGWSKETFNKLIQMPPEALVSRFQVTHGMLLNVLSRGEEGCRSMQRLIRGCHDTDHAKRGHRKRAWELFRALLERQIVVPGAGPGRAGKSLQINVKLQDDFSLNESLSVYLLDTVKLLDIESPTYPLDLLTLVESIVENPDIVLRKQLDRIKTKEIARMKAEGIEYDERMLKLEELEYPKPNREFIYSTFNEFAAKHPWVGAVNVRPKSVVREMFESFMTFADYIRQYDLHKVEGVLLRYVMSVYKAMNQSVPDLAKSEPVFEMETYLKAMISATDSSLLDEWERMKNPEYQAAAKEAPKAIQIAGPPDITQDRRTFAALVRNEVFGFVRCLATGELEPLAALAAGASDDEGRPWDVARLSALLETYLAEHEVILLNPEARNLRHTHVAESPTRWDLAQTLVDPKELNDWSLNFLVDLAESRAASKPVLKFGGFGPISRM